MKKNTHPSYGEVLFVDSSNGVKFICGSTLQPEETELFEGKEYPVCRVAVSSASHPFFTKSRQYIDTEGRVDKFTKRYAKKREQSQQEQKKQEIKKEPKRAKRKPKKP